MFLAVFLCLIDPQFLITFVNETFHYDLQTHIA